MILEAFHSGREYHHVNMWIIGTKTKSSSTRHMTECWWKVKSDPHIIGNHYDYNNYYMDTLWYIKE